MDTFEEGPIQTADSFERADLTQHRDYIQKLIVSWNEASTDDKVAVGHATVLTGELITEGPSKGRGKEELADERGFRKVARERGIGLRVTHRHLQDGKTMLRLSPQEKKEFSAEAVAKRSAALEKRRDRLAVEKYAKDHNKLVSQLTKAEAETAIKQYREAVAARKAAAQKKTAAKAPAS